MDDDKTNLEELKKEIREFVEERNWIKYHHPKELAVSIAIEVGELLEIFQWDDKADIQQIKNDKETMKRIKSELADITMYILSFANQLDIDITDSVLQKLKQNRIKYEKNMVLKTGAYRKDKLMEFD
ncbi:nucleotide pyrophosphohydrolase [Candidatus Poribacteria bacterium]|nr:nucleotide pyrophosphohydrolase [Candidatus Poribacteria bacterium]